MIRWSIVATLTVLLATLTACTKDVDAGGNKGAAIEAGDKYVALGDSYTSGGYLGEQTGAEGCLQSDANYPHLVAKALDLELDDVSCGGARPDHLENPQLPVGGRVAPQLDAVTKDTKLVTLSLGGNQDGLFASVVVTCVNLGGKDPGGQPCTDLAEQRKAKLDRGLKKITKEIKDGIGKILERAPKARVIVVGYPQIVPATGWCPALPLAPADYGVGRQVFHDVTEALRKGAEEADAEYVDVWSLSEGHDICAKDPWVEGAARNPERKGFAYHPYAEEHEAVADLLVAQVSGDGKAP
ncbi:MAG: SGNH/GDSL hydrolase family protein [Propionibacteriales bacterium]|nr:SGNH/GDSL hydrolase family protein [Propionibacteriales bacterium]